MTYHQTTSNIPVQPAWPGGRTREELCPSFSLKKGENEDRRMRGAQEKFGKQKTSVIITKEYGTDDIAKVYVGTIRGRSVEFAESLEKPLPREEKWVIIVSCMFGCPVHCLMCDAGKSFHGLLNAEEILAQIDAVVRRRYPDGNISAHKWKIQFARMGEPALNNAVLDVLTELPKKYNAPGLLPCISTIGPHGCSAFFQKLHAVKETLYASGKFQLQFSIHTTDIGLRDRLIPMRKMMFAEIAAYGARFVQSGDRKITLNFAVMHGYPIDHGVIERYFDPSYFLIKLTPLNPTGNAKKHRLATKLNPYNSQSADELVDAFKNRGFDVIVSIGNTEENSIGSNCGQYITTLASSMNHP